jgi:hypothetical protein
MNKMNLTNLQVMVNEKFTTKKIEIGEYEINVDMVFRDSKVSAMIKEYLEKLEYTKANNIEINNTDYALLLMTKYFTDIEYPSEYEAQIQIFTILVDLGILNIILGEFGEEGLKIITEKLNTFNENLSKMTEELNEKNNKNDTKNFVGSKGRKKN